MTATRKTRQARNNAGAIGLRAYRASGTRLTNYPAIICFMLLWASARIIPAIAEDGKLPPGKFPELKAMVAEYIVVQKQFRGKTYQAYITPYKEKDKLGSKANLFFDCEQCRRVQFYIKYKNIIDNLDTSRYKTVIQIHPNSKIDNILSDPRQIVFELKSEVRGYWALARATNTLSYPEMSFDSYTKEIIESTEKKLRCDGFETERRQRGLIR